MQQSFTSTIPAWTSGPAPTGIVLNYSFELWRFHLWMCTKTKIANVFFIIFRKKVQISCRKSKIVWNNCQSQTSGSRGLGIHNWSSKIIRNFFKADILWQLFFLFDLISLSSSLCSGNWMFQLKIFTKYVWDQGTVLFIILSPPVKSYVVKWS